MNSTQKEHIDSLTVEQLLSDHRFAPVGSPIFQGEEGTYRTQRLAELRSKDPEAYTRASKDIGWIK